jgi:uncharacterized protein (TIGR02118 family)
MLSAQPARPLGLWPTTSEEVGVAKIVFILQRRDDKTPDDVRTQWSSEAHLARLRQLPGLTRFVHNYVVASPAGHVCDGVGEMWFENDEMMHLALSSPQMEAAVESATSFLDMEKTRMVIVEEKTVIG